MAFTSLDSGIPVPTPADGPRASPPTTYGPMAPRVADYVATVPIKHQARFRRVLGGGHASLRDRVNAMCLQCSGYQFEEVRNCPVWRCPLHAARPYQADAVDTDDQADRDQDGQP